MGVGSERSASGGANVAEGEIEDLVDSVIGGERSACLGDFSKLVIERLDGVRGVNDFADSGLELEERDGGVNNFV